MSDAESAFRTLDPAEPDVLCLRAEQRFSLRDRLQILLTGRVELEQRVACDLMDGWHGARIEAVRGAVRWTTRWRWPK